MQIGVVFPQTEIGTDPGAIYGGIHEKAVVLAVALATIRKLKALGVQAIPTRTSDTRPSLDARASLANRRKADLFISIHADSASRRSASGGGAFFRADGARGRQSRKLAVAVVDGIVTRTDASNRRARADSRGLRVLRKTHMPAILLEIGFLTNAAERRRLVDARYQERVAQGIVDGINQVNYGKIELANDGTGTISAREGSGKFLWSSLFNYR